VLVLLVPGTWHTSRQDYVLVTPEYFFHWLLLVLQLVVVLLYFREGALYVEREVKKMPSLEHLLQIQYRTKAVAELASGTWYYYHSIWYQVLQVLAYRKYNIIVFSSLCRVGSAYITKTYFSKEIMMVFSQIVL